MMVNGTTTTHGGPPERRLVGLETLVRLGIPLQRLDLPGERVEEFASEHGDSGGLADGLRRRALLLLALRDVHVVTLLVALPDIGKSLGVSTALLGFGLLLELLLLPAVAFAFAARVDSPGRRIRTAAMASPALPSALLLTALAPGALALLGLGLAYGAAGGLLEVLLLPLVVDRPAQEDGSRRSLGGLDAWAARLVGAGVALLAVGATMGLLDATWRVGAVVTAVLAAAVVGIASPRLRSDSPPDDGDVPGAAVLGAFERLRRVSLLPTARRAMTASGVLGLFAGPLLVHGVAVLEHRSGVGLAGRGVLVGLALTLGGAAGTALASRRLTATSRAGMSSVLRRAVPILAVGALVLVLSPLVAGTATGVVATLLLAWAALAAGAGVVSAALFEVLPRGSRAVTAAAATAFFGPVGAVGGLLLSSSIDRRFGPAVAVAVTAVAALALARTVRELARSFDDDLRRSHAGLCEEAELVARRRAGLAVPMLTCRSIDFSYGQLQVLFGVDFTVDEGEMVALLGTNGAGKSTLLRVISGLGLPSGGRVHFGGQDITYLDPERRIAHGIAQIPGGKAVFGPMTVLENLRVFGHALGRSQAELDAGIEATLAAFPRLDERRHQLASTLSGGEQQMLALGKAFIVRPRLLLIDELSLGLAPIVVGQLLDMVRAINAEGTAVVLVEQSVNVALSLVNHAYFMEKGEIRFDGRASELLDRRDLLRSVFLEGVGQGES